MTPKVGDDQLASHVNEAKAGDERAFVGIYESLAGSVAGYIRSRGVGDVDDVVNEVFLGAFRNLGTFEGDGARFRSWLFSIAHNKAADWHRQQSRQVATTDDPARAHLRVVGGDAEAEAMIGITRDDVDRMLGRLTPDQRDVVMLRVLADLSLEQVAEVVDKPVGAVKSLQRRALLSLARSLQGEAVSP